MRGNEPSIRQEMRISLTRPKKELPKAREKRATGLGTGIFSHKYPATINKEFSDCFFLNLVKREHFKKRMKHNHVCGN